MESYERKVEVIHGEVIGTKDFSQLTLTWLKPREELENEWQKADPVGYSQHSSIVMSEFAPSHAMAFDRQLVHVVHLTIKRVSSGKIYCIVQTGAIL